MLAPAWLVEIRRKGIIRTETDVQEFLALVDLLGRALEHAHHVIGPCDIIDAARAAYQRGPQ